MLSHGADPNSIDESTGFTPLLSLANHCQPGDLCSELVASLVISGCDVNFSHGGKCLNSKQPTHSIADIGTTLMYAIQGGHNSLVKALLLLGPDVINSDFVNSRYVSLTFISRLTPYRGRTPLHLACVYGHEEIVQLLFELKPNTSDMVAVYDNYGFTPLHEAAAFGHTNVCSRGILPGLTCN